MYNLLVHKVRNRENNQLLRCTTTLCFIDKSRLFPTGSRIDCVSTSLPRAANREMQQSEMSQRTAVPLNFTEAKRRQKAVSEEA